MSSNAPIPEITPEGVKPFPPTGYRMMDARTNFFYGVTGITPGMAMRLTGIGSQYLFAMTDARRNFFDGAKTYKVVPCRKEYRRRTSGHSPFTTT